MRDNVKINRIAAKLVLAVVGILTIQVAVHSYLEYRGDADLLWKEWLRRGRLHALGLARAAEYGLLTRDREELRRVAEMTRTPDDTGLLYVAFYDESGDLVTVKDWSGGAAAIPRHEEPAKEFSVGGPEHTHSDDYDFHAPVRVSRQVVGEAVDRRAQRGPDDPKAEYAMVMTRRSTVNLTARIVEQQRRTLLANACVFVAAGVVLSVFAFRLVRPVRTLVRGTERIAAGDLVTRMDVGRRRDELGTLADSFNRMTGQLRHQREQIVAYSRDLEQKVAKRTAELSKANEGLKREVAERKRAEEALVRSNTELEQFAYIASHDLQEPLRMVSGYVKMLERRYKGKLDADADDFIGFAVDGAERMSVLINDLLAYSRVTTRGKQFEPTGCEAVMEEVLSNLEVAVTETGATVTHDPLPTVMADRTQLGRLLQNLIGNAIKYHGEAPPEIHVSAKQTGGAWQFAVRDNGIGIEPQYHERIFAIFKRLHARDEYEGTGIGLAVARKIVERHGGRIWIESEPGTGSTFYFTIPQREVRTHDNSSDHPADEVYANAGQTGGDTPG